MNEWSKVNLCYKCEQRGCVNTRVKLVKNLHLNARAKERK
jgi:hypothetical protein